jgi:hypothetical protein
MKRTLALITLALAALMVVASPVGAAPPAGKKQWICHFTGKKYVAIDVSKNALAKHLAEHQDVVDANVVPQNRAAARTYCAGLTPLTLTRGGTTENTHLTSGSLAATLGLRLRLGQGQLCYTLAVTQTPAATLTVNSATLTPTSGSPVSLDLTGLTVTGTTPLTLSKCQNVSRSTVKSLLQNRSSYTASVVTTAGTLTATLGA